MDQIEQLNYIQLIKNDLKQSQNGGILIMSEGTGVYNVLAEYLDTFVKSPSTQIFLLNFDGEEISEINYYLKNHQIIDVSPLLSQKRSETYLQGGIFSISANILIFDLLSKQVIIPSQLINGIIINQIDTCDHKKENLCWLATILKFNNPFAFILGISQRIKGIVSKGLDKLMNWFYINKCFLWTLQREEIQMELQNKKNQFKTIDATVDITKRMKKIISCIKIIIVLILNELQIKEENNRYINIFTQEEFFNSSIYELKQKILQNELFSKFCNNNQLVLDVFQYKKLLQDVFNLDCIRFYQRLININENMQEDSYFKITDNNDASNALNQLFEEAKKRIYEISKTEETINVDVQTQYLGQVKENQFNIDFDEQSQFHLQQEETQIKGIQEQEQETNSQQQSISEENKKFIYKFCLQHKIKLNFELDPKLLCLSANLQDIFKKYEPFIAVNGEKYLIWIHTNDQRKVKDIQNYLTSFFLKEDQKNKLLLFKQLRNLLTMSQKTRFRKIQSLKNNKNQYEQKEIEPVLLQSLFQELNFLQQLIEYDQISLTGRADEEEQQDDVPKKRKFEISEENLTKFKLLKNIQDLKVFLIDDINENGESFFFAEQIHPKFTIIVNSINKSVTRQQFLKQYKPNFVILVEPNVNILREISVFQHIIQQNGVNPVYELRNLIYNNELESQQLINQIQNENIATEKIVKAKSQIVDSIEDYHSRVKVIQKKTNTRLGGVQQHPTIIVDKREFRSDLPSILYHEGFNVVPVQLDVGDYILSKEIAIERKSVQTHDLISSLRNGRLDKQLQEMSKKYKKSYLLIEFADSINFNLESVNYNFFGYENDNYKRNKVSILTQYLPAIMCLYPNVNIIWSRGPEFTAKIFQNMKQNAPEPPLQEYLNQQKKNETNDLEQQILLNTDSNSKEMNFFNQLD